MKGPLDNIPKRHGHKSRVANTAKPGRVAALFEMGYRPFIQHAHDIALKDGKASVHLRTRDLGGGDVGLVMEIPEEVYKKRSEFKQIINDLDSLGFDRTAELDGIVAREKEAFLRNKSLWFFIKSKVIQGLKSILGRYTVRWRKQFVRMLPWVLMGSVFMMRGFGLRGANTRSNTI